ncbi:MAG TPA: hypothetical protein VMH90_02155 [Thermoplasmata archaeon]|nr:hypothetical protein [Thermoplasmata archaeon]
MPEGGFVQAYGKMPMARQIGFWLFAALILIAGVFYVWWGVSFGVWIDNGLYAVLVTLVLFGLAGMWLMLPDPPVTSPIPPRS